VVGVGDGRVREGNGSGQLVGGDSLLVIDNYDSFTYNLVQLLGELGAHSVVVRNDAVTVEEVARQAPRGIVISPGPKLPEEAGICVELVRRLGQTTPILGVCLGHQAIGVAYGGRVVRAPAVVHGKVGKVHHTGTGVLSGLDNPLMATRYHSLVVARAGLPPLLEVTAWSDDNLIMGLRHVAYPVEGVQFHPESIGTPSGRALLSNFLVRAGVPLRVPG
jgi:anthranilate synthase component II